MYERYIEKLVYDGVKKMGGLCYKFISPNQVGVPDRIIITPEGEIIFAELKTSKGVLSKMQEWQIKKLRKCKANVEIIRGEEEAKAFLLKLQKRQERLKNSQNQEKEKTSNAVCAT